MATIYSREKAKLIVDMSAESRRVAIRKWRAANPEKDKAATLLWRNRNPDKVKAQNRIGSRRWRARHRDQNLVKSRKWRQENPHYQSERSAVDPIFKLSVNIRKRLGVALRNNQKSGSAIRDLGCSIEELKLHLENKFQPGMAWENWALDGWHIDHIIPVKNFDLTDREQFLKACHFTNLQPLWAKDNLSKGSQ